MATTIEDGKEAQWSAASACWLAPADSSSSSYKKDRNLVFVLIGTPGLDLTWSPSNGVMMMI
jgi:hypothetical protein